LLSIGGEFQYRENGESLLIKPTNRLPESTFHIESIGLGGNQRLADRDLERIAGLSELQQLYVQETAITDDGLRILQEMKTLVTLNVRETKVTAMGVAQLKLALPDCQIKSDFTAEQIAAAVEKLKK